MTVIEVLSGLGLGLIVGFLSGLIGLGGGILLTPMMRLVLGIPQLIALATPLPVLFPTAISGSVAYYREKQADFKLAGWLLVGAVPMTWIGASMTQYFSGRTLMIFTAVFIMFVSCNFLLRGFLLKYGNEHPPLPTEPLKAIVIGAVGGFFAGLLAIGGGIIYIPAILFFFRRPMKSVQATSLIAVTIVAIPGTIKHTMMGNIDWLLAAVVACGTIPASYLGARVALKLHNNTLERVFGILTFLFGLYFLIHEL